MKSFYEYCFLALPFPFKRYIADRHNKSIVLQREGFIPVCQVNGKLYALKAEELNRTSISQELRKPAAALSPQKRTRKGKGSDAQR